MLPTRLLCALAVLAVARASVGDNLPEFRNCVTDCKAQVCDAHATSKYTENSVNPVSRVLFMWDCPLDCNYKCQQSISAGRRAAALPMVQFYGKWPFRRVLGVTELASTAFSLANLYVNYANLAKVTRLYRASLHANPQGAAMLKQYLILLWVSVVGWVFSTVFHVRDIPLTETLDYLGAGAIIVANFNAICVRSFHLNRSDRALRRQVFQLALLVVLGLHYASLRRHWDYAYNMLFNTVVGLLALVLWMLVLWLVYLEYRSKLHIYNNSIHLLPYETRILTKLNFVGLSRSKYIPLLPFALNVFLIFAVSLEMVDFDPWWQLVDAHSLWHLCTVFPPIVWYDWNLWDVELQSLLP